jgi:hypothetical protein
MKEWIRIPAVSNDGGVSKALPWYEIIGIGKYFFLVEASSIPDAANRIIEYAYKESGKKADIFKSLDSILPAQRNRYFFSTELGVAIKYPRDEIKGILHRE